jgi:hypothetical protein
MKTIIIVEILGLFLLVSCGERQNTSKATVSQTDHVSRTFRLAITGQPGGTPNEGQSLCINALSDAIDALPVKCSKEKRDSYLGACPLPTEATPGAGWVSTAVVDVTCP